MRVAIATLLSVLLLIGCGAASPQIVLTTEPAPAATASVSPGPRTTLGPATAGLELRVIPRTIRRGVHMTLISTGFNPNESVDFFFLRPDGSETGLETTVADASGAAMFAFDVPGDWERGTWLAVAASSSNHARHAQLEVLVGPN